MGILSLFLAASLSGPWTGTYSLGGSAQVAFDVSGKRVRCQVDSDKLDHLLKALTAAGVRTLTSQPPTLEELFLRHYGDQQAATGAEPAAVSQ